MRQLYAPNGKKIVGTSDLAPVTSYVCGWEEDGTPIYADDEAKVYLDASETRKNEAGVMYVVDSSGDDHLVTDCAFREA